MKSCWRIETTSFSSFWNYLLHSQCILRRGEYSDFIIVGVAVESESAKVMAQVMNTFSQYLSFVLSLEIQMITPNTTNRNPVASEERASSITRRWIALVFVHDGVGSFKHVIKRKRSFFYRFSFFAFSFFCCRWTVWTSEREKIGHFFQSSWRNARSRLHDHHRWQRLSITFAGNLI